MATPQILIVLHQNDNHFESRGYLIKFLLREWEAMGLTVQVVRGITSSVRADVVIPHVDLTITPAEYRDYLLAYPKVINGQVVDISKSRISTNLVARNDSYTGPVIVKTERNYGGLPEQWLGSRLRGGQKKWGGVIRRLLGHLPSGSTRGIDWRSVQSLSPSAYPVFGSVREVPAGVFANRHLIVEKFLPEIVDGDYCLRYYYFFGAKGVNLVFRSKDRVVKAANALTVEEVPIPEELYLIREKLGFDYGKFDYVLRDRKVVLFDANRTPATAALRQWGLTEKVAKELAGELKPQLAPS